MIIFLSAILISCLFSFLITPTTIWLFIRQGWVEDPRLKRKKVDNATALTPVPRGGGLPIFFSLLFTSLFLLPLDKHLLGILLAALLTLIVGLWDDLRDISPKLRLFTNVFAAAIVVASGIGIAYISNPFGGIIDLSFLRLTFNFFGTHSFWVLSGLLAIIWLAWCMNSVGWATGVEGQLPGFAAISAFFIGLLAMRFADRTQLPVIVLAGAVTGAYLGFLPFNFYPQKIMPGYSGKSLAGFFLGLLAILSGAKLATVIFVLGVPMLDAGFTIFRRLKNHRSIFQGDGQHLHHRLLRLGWSRPQIALTYWAFSLILGFIALFLNSRQKFYVFIGIGLLFLAFIARLSSHKPMTPTRKLSR
ncbi:undecaprenyl/decaprenyl-phosphate alpha-N-acetylglucosaminyl 1-phosphate transferase [Patescibacteria group bacterium]|nr:undecaprenyl/decaprenyl-phosphate alpha-N-acetylglucosaminyl 1-phosphate transferase [Patescibacteria group bacterium]